MVVVVVVGGFLVVVVVVVGFLVVVLEVVVGFNVDVVVVVFGSVRESARYSLRLFSSLASAPFSLRWLSTAA